MRGNKGLRSIAALFFAGALIAGAACSDDDDEATAGTTEQSSDDSSDTTMAGDSAMPASSAEACDASQITAMVQSGAEQGTLEGMTDDPVGTAASNNPVLTTLTQAVTAANLVDTLNAAPALTVFAPTDCAFAAADPATIEAALADPTGLLTTVLGFHVVPGEELDAAALAGETSVTTLTGEELSISVSGDTVTVGDQAEVVVPDIQTANATVHLIDSVMVPPSVG
jgi:transforming growth factor-beta-induced protein